MESNLEDTISPNQTSPMNRLFSPNFPTKWLLWLAIAVFVASLAALWYKLGSLPLFDWDEAIYAFVAKDLGSTGDFLTLTSNGTPWFDKPPLQFWITSLFLRMIDSPETAARAISALAGAGSATIILIWGTKLRNLATGLLGAAILLTTLHFVDISRDGMLDSFLTFWVTLTLLAGYLAQKNPRYWLLAGLAAGAAMMTKGAAGLIAPVSLLISIFFQPKPLDTLKSGWFWSGVGTMLLTALPWHLIMYFRHGDAFVQAYINYHVVTRAQTAIEGHGGTWIQYVLTIRDRAFPWAWLYLPSLLYGLWASYKFRQLTFLILTPFLIFGLYAFGVDSKLSQYIIPIYPFASLGCALFLNDWFAVKGWYRYLAIPLIIVGLYLGGQQVQKSYSRYGTEAVDSVKELEGVQLLNIRPSSQKPLVIIGGIKAWPSFDFYTYRRQVYRDLDFEAFQSLFLQSPDGIEVLAGKGESVPILDNTQINQLGESGNFRFSEIVLVDHN